MRVVSLIFYILMGLLSLVLGALLVFIGTALLRGEPVWNYPLIGSFLTNLQNADAATLKTMTYPFLIYGGFLCFEALIAIGGIIQIFRKSTKKGVHVIAIIVGVFSPYFLLAGIFGLICARNFARMGY